MQRSGDLCSPTSPPASTRLGDLGGGKRGGLGGSERGGWGGLNRGGRGWRKRGALGVGEMRDLGGGMQPLRGAMRSHPVTPKIGSTFVPFWCYIEKIFRAYAPLPSGILVDETVPMFETPRFSTCAVISAIGLRLITADTWLGMTAGWLAISCSGLGIISAGEDVNMKTRVFHTSLCLH